MMGYIPKGGGGPGGYYGLPFTPPNDGDFSWVNQGAADKILTPLGVLVYAPQSATENWRFRVVTPPATPWYLVTFFMTTQTYAGFGRAGLCFYDTGGGRMKNVVLSYGQEWQTQQMNSVSSHNSEANIGNYGRLALTPHGVWCQLADNGVNRQGYFSGDGRTWMKGYDENRTTWLTANRVGFGVSPNNASLGLSIHMVHWKFHTSFQGTLIST